MRPGTYTAKTRCDSWYFLNRSAFTKLLETPQLDNLEVGVLDLALVIEKNVYLCVAFQPSGRGYANNFFFNFIFFVFKFRVAHVSYLVFRMLYFVLFFFYDSLQEGFW
ncbi:hypothetical protein ES703_75895 [subsurface metagenome]